MNVESFQIAIEQAICVSQVVSVDDPAFLSPPALPLPLLGRIFLTRSRSAGFEHHKHVSVIRSINQTLDALSNPSPHSQSQRHQRIAEATVKHYPNLYLKSGKGPLDSHAEGQLEHQNLVSGAIVLGDLPLLERLLSNGTTVDLNVISPYFGLPLTLAASYGHIPIVRRLLHMGADPRQAFNNLEAQSQEDKD